MIEHLLSAVAILFVTVAPVNNAVFFSSMTKQSTPDERRAMAFKANLVALGILLVFALFGNELLRFLGIRLSSLQISGGMLLFLIAIKMVMSQPKTSLAGNSEDGDIAIFPFATPMMAGPSSIIAVMVMMGKARGDYLTQVLILAVIIAMLAVSLALFLICGKLARFLGKQGNEVVIRLLGVLLAALSVEMILDGLTKSALFEVS